MRSGKRNQEDEEYEDDDFGTRKEGLSSTNTNNVKEGKSNDQKANAIRSKHSVTEQRRRSKINERFQILRDLIPHSDQKRDTASFLLEVVEYVQYLQEKVQKYEGLYQGWSPEPTKLMPWRNSHWRVQSFVGHPQPLKNCSGPGSTFSGKFDESNTSITPTMLTNAQDQVESDLGGDAICRPTDQLPELANQGIAMPIPLQVKSPAPVQNDSRHTHPLHRPVSDVQSTDSHTTGDILNQHDDLMIEGGTISISSVYSQGLLNTLTQALQNAGVDLSQANMSVQIDLGKRANRQQTSGTFLVKDNENPRSSNKTTTHPREASSEEDSDQAQKRPKTWD